MGDAAAVDAALMAAGLFARGAAERAERAQQLAAAAVTPDDVTTLLRRAARNGARDAAAVVAGWIRAGTWPAELAAQRAAERDPPLPGGRYVAQLTEPVDCAAHAAQVAWSRLTGDRHDLSSVAADLGRTARELLDLLIEHAAALPPLGRVTEQRIAAEVCAAARRPAPAPQDRPSLDSADVCTERLRNRIAEEGSDDVP